MFFFVVDFFVAVVVVRMTMFCISSPTVMVLHRTFFKPAGIQ